MGQTKQAFNALDDERSVKADALHRVFIDHGIDFATGVPCGVLRHVIRNLGTSPTIFHVPATRESEAVGIAAGAYFAGKRVVLYMQNSGLFVASNDIASLLIPYRISLFFVVTFRGCEGEDAIQHLVTGNSTCSLLSSFGLPHVVYDGGDIEMIARQLFTRLTETSLPGVLLLKRGWHQ